VAGDGSRPWGSSSIVIADTSVTTAEAPDVVPDGMGGAFISWIVTTPRDIHIQHVNAAGTFLWPQNGTIVYSATGAERDTYVTADGTGGIYVAWETSQGAHLHRVDSSGMLVWAGNGLRFTPGFDPRIGTTSRGPLVIYRNFTGLSARLIELPELLALRLTAAQWQGNQMSFVLDGGIEGINYDVLRKTALAGSNWQSVGTVRQGEKWTDSSSPLPNAFYIARESSDPN
jgi:hypothetical protein